MSDEVFPCTGCGCCCKRVKYAVEWTKTLDQDWQDKLHFPYGWDDTGRCDMLDEDNRCKVYDNRPILCSVEGFRATFNLPKLTFYQENIDSCNRMMDEDNVPIEFRITKNYRNED